MWVLRFLPLSYLSWFVGFFANLPLPQPLARWSIRLFAYAYSIDPSLATRPLSAFRSIGEFFTRDLRPELRPVEGDFVFPVDGTLRAVEVLSGDGVVTQVKGKTYSLSKLLGDVPSADRLARGQLWNMYLSPCDAHHIYAPVSGKIVKTVHVPGALWPVNDWALRSVGELFAINERVVTYIESETGLIAVVMVGATNVGRISLCYTELETNLAPWKAKKITVVDHTPFIEISCGEKIGTFKMGSSVVMVRESPFHIEGTIRCPRSICYGQSPRKISCLDS